MKAISLYFLFSFLVIFNCSASDVIKAPTKSPSEYYNYVFTAEKFIMQGDFDSALYYYAKSLSTEIRYRIDVPNLNKCLINANDDNIKIGLFSHSYLHSDSTVTPDLFIKRVSLFFTKEGIEKLRDSISGKAKYVDKDSINYVQISKILEDLGVADQKCRGTESSKGDLSEMERVDADNFSKLINLYTQYGFFTTSKLQGAAFPAYKHIITHNFYDKERYIKHNDFFIREVKSGRLDAREYAGIVDHYRFDSTQVYGCNTVFSVGDSLVVFHLSDSGKEKINNNRKLIFLQDIDTVQEKMIWQWKNPDSFWFESVLEVGHYPNETATDVAKQKLKEMGSFATGYEIISR